MVRFFGAAFLAGMLVFGLGLGGCGGGGDDGPTAPTGTGNTIVVDPSPDTIDAPWTLAGPAGYTHGGHGDATVSDLEVGEYWIVWAEVEGWHTPVQSNQTLPEGGQLTFTGVYEFIGSGTVVVDVSPDGLGLPWVLAGPGDLSVSATGDSTLTAMLPGQYTLTWQALTGWIRPAAATLDLARDGTITFSGTYVSNDGTGAVIVDAAPDYLTPAWALHGPDGYVHSGQGDETLSGLVAGEYSLYWDDLSGWIPPEPQLQLLLASGVVTFSGVYVEQDALPGFRLLPPTEVAMPVGFLMGGSLSADETPHTVHLTHRFHLGELEVTNGQYVELIQWAYSRGYVAATPYSANTTLDFGSAQLLDLDDDDCQISFADGVFSTQFPLRPVIDISWYGAAAYCDWLNLQQGLPRSYHHYNWRCNNNDPYGAKGYRLPTEAEWELSCRAGTATDFSTGACLDSQTEANFNGAYPLAGCPVGAAEGHTVDVGGYPANPWGLHDMHGNVFEWCNDRYGVYGGDATDPIGVLDNENRVIRGGGFSYEAVYCRSAARSSWAPNYFAAGTGFRVARSAF